LLQQQRIFLHQIMQHDALEWKYSDKQLRQDVTYAVLLLLAFTFLSCFFITPVGPGLQIFLNVAGSGLCWGLNVWNDAVLQFLKIDQAHEITAIAQQIQQTVIEQMNDDLLNDSKKRLLYLDYLASQAQCAQQQALINEHLARLLYTIAIELTVPPMLFGVLVFLPFGEALLILVIVVIIANYLQELLMHESNFSNQADTVFDEEAFLQFKTMAATKQSPPLLDIQPLIEQELEESTSGYANVSP